MRVEFDRDTCTEIFNCVHESETVVEDRDAGKAPSSGRATISTLYGY